MAIDVRQELRQEGARREVGPVPGTPKHGAWTLVLGVAAIVAVVGAVALFALQDDAAPVGGSVLNYPETAYTTEREGGEYVVVPEPVAGYADTLVGIREGGGYAVVTPEDPAGGGEPTIEEMQQKSGMAEAGVTSIGGTPSAG